MLESVYELAVEKNCIEVTIEVSAFSLVAQVRPKRSRCKDHRVFWVGNSYTAECPKNGLGTHTSC